MWKRNRFAEMVPPTPEDFHAGVADALNRLESAPARSGSYGGMVRLAASVAVVIALGSCLLVALRSRPTPEDRMVSLVESMPTPEVQEAMPIDYYGRYEYQTPYGSDWLDQPMVDFANAEFYRERGDLEEEMDALRRRSELRSILLETHGFAEPVVSYCGRIDMSAGSGTGATEMTVIDP